MKTKKFLFMELLGAVVVSAMAVIFHNLYELSNRNFYVGLISATNESVFEHVKIIFFPYLIWTILEYLVLKPRDYKKFFTAKLFILCVISLLEIVFYYTYVGIIGYNIMAVDISSAFVYVIIGFVWSYNWIISKNFTSYNASKVFPFAVMLFIIFWVAIIYFSVSPIKIPLFYDTESKLYGMK